MHFRRNSHSLLSSWKLFVTFPSLQVSSSFNDDDGDDEDEEEPATIGERIRETVSKPIEQLKSTAEKVGQQLKAQVIVSLSLSFLEFELLLPL